MASQKPWYENTPQWLQESPMIKDSLRNTTDVWDGIVNDNNIKMAGQMNTFNDELSNNVNTIKGNLHSEGVIKANEKSRERDIIYGQLDLLKKVTATRIQKEFEEIKQRFDDDGKYFNDFGSGIASNWVDKMPDLANEHLRIQQQFISPQVQPMSYTPLPPSDIDPRVKQFKRASKIIGGPLPRSAYSEDIRHSRFIRAGKLITDSW